MRHCHPAANGLEPATITVNIGSPLTFGTATNDRTGWLRISDELAAAVRALGGEQS